MKAIIFVAVLLVGYSNAKPHPAKRSATCSGLPKQLSGRLYVALSVTMYSSEGEDRIYLLQEIRSDHLISLSLRPTLTSMNSNDNIEFQLKEVMAARSETSDIHFNLDLNQQRFQADSTIDGQPYSVYADFKDKKYYLVSAGRCISSHGDGLPSLSDMEEVLNKMSLDVSGKLGLNGATVDLYSSGDGGASVVLTLESGDQCIPVSYAAKQADGSAMTGSFFDLKTAVDPEKMKIPEKCEHSQSYGRRSLPATLHTAYLKEAMKRGFPWVVGATQKRGFPWVQGATQKRGFPWVNGDSQE